MTKAEKRFPLGDESIKIVSRAAQAVWQYIGYDCIDANDGKDLSRATVVEVVMDASRLDDELRKVKNVPADLQELLAIDRDWNHADWKLASTRITAIVRQAFPYSRYGL